MHAFLSQTAEYALRAMAWLAYTSPEAPVRARDLSEGTRIPAQYLAKILRRLVVSGVLESRKGHGGGFSLARPAAEISFREVLTAVDAYPAEERCAFGWGECDASHPCPLHEPWARMSEQFTVWASTTTLADVRGPLPKRPEAPHGRPEGAPPRRTP